MQKEYFILKSMQLGEKYLERKKRDRIGEENVLMMPQLMDVFAVCVLQLYFNSMLKGERVKE